MLPLLHRACDLALQREPLVQAATLFRSAQVLAPLAPDEARSRFSAGAALLDQLRLPDEIRRALEHNAIRAGASADPDGAVALLRRSPVQAILLQRDRLVPVLIAAFMNAGEVTRAIQLCEEFGGDPDSASLMLWQGSPDPLVQRRVLAAVREQWRRRELGPGVPSNPFSSYFQLLAAHWRQLPRAEAEQWLQEAVEAIAVEPEQSVQAGFGDDVTFTSLRDMQLFLLLNPLAELWPPHQLEALLAAHPQLAVAAQRHPRGMQSILAERMAQAATPAGGGSGLGHAGGGGSEAAASQWPLALRAHAGDPGVITDYFADALRSFRQDTDPAEPNAAPRIFWPSCYGYRRAAYWTGRLEGAAGEARLNQVPDHDFMPISLVDFAAGILGQPAPSGTMMAQRQPS